MWQEKIRTALKNKNMTQEDLAIDAELSQSAISAFLSGRKNPSLDSLIKIVAALDMTLMELFTPVYASFNPFVPNEDEKLLSLKHEIQQLLESTDTSQLESVSLLLAITKKILR